MRSALVSSEAVRRLDSLVAGDHLPPAPADVLRAYRSKHRIAPASTGEYAVCEVDGIRIHSSAGGRWRHDLGEIRLLVEFAPIDR